MTAALIAMWIVANNPTPKTCRSAAERLVDVTSHEAAYGRGPIHANEDLRAIKEFYNSCLKLTKKRKHK